MKRWGRVTLFLLAAVMFATFIAFVPIGKEDGKMTAEVQRQPVPVIDRGKDVSFETATFSLG